MNSWSWLETELKKQEAAIVKKEGVINKAYTNVSPKEITAAIATIPHQDLSSGTATEEDVKQGKIFFSGSSTPRVGTANIAAGETTAIFMAPYEEVSFDGEIFYTIPSSVTRVRDYCFYKNYNNINITFSNTITRVEPYAFYRTPNFSFSNFSNLTNLEYVGTYSFAYCGCNDTKIGRFPSSLKDLYEYSFYEAGIEQEDFVFPSSLKTLGANSFMKSSRVVHNTLDMSQIVNIKTLASYVFYFNAFNCDFICPSSVQTISTYFNYNGCFRNIYFHSDLQSINSYCFGAGASMPLENYYLKSVVFAGETPPATIGKNIFANQNVTNGLKIYVPDNSVEEYKAVTNFSAYADIILPISQKP